MVAPPSTAGRVLVTGANGSLGQALLEHLMAAGIAVRALVRSERAAATLRSVERPPEVMIVEWSDGPGLERACADCDAVVHLVGVLKETPTQRYEVAHEGTARALAAAALSGPLRRIIYLSIIGASADSANACLASKARAEAILLAAPLATTVLRFPMVLGGDDPASWSLRARAKARIAPMVRGGASLEQPIDVRDVIAAIAAALSEARTRRSRAGRRGTRVAAAPRTGSPRRGNCRQRTAHRVDSARLDPWPGVAAGAFDRRAPPSPRRCSTCSSTTTASIRISRATRSGSSSRHSTKRCTASWGMYLERAFRRGEAPVAAVPPALAVADHDRVLRTALHAHRRRGASPGLVCASRICWESSRRSTGGAGSR